MADINQVITLGIGTPADIEHFLLLGLGVGESPQDTRDLSAYRGAVRSNRWRGKRIYHFGSDDAKKAVLRSRFNEERFERKKRKP